MLCASVAVVVEKCYIVETVGCIYTMSISSNPRTISVFGRFIASTGKLSAHWENAAVILQTSWAVRTAVPSITPVHTMTQKMTAPNCTRCWSIFKRISPTNSTVNLQINKYPATSSVKRVATLPCDSSSTTVPVSDCRLFSDIYISQGSVATHLEGGGIFE